ncbi:MAG TPA: class I SAM-dependent methyltransferase [Stellaceae bacterium]|nr:class I SAM-dependent methyltransferase [Stellaceae bacterium]
MSRLDSNIRRLVAQRACLDRAAALIRGREGVVFELGLGNGRTYDHLRENLPDRAIYVFECLVTAHPDCVPAAEYLIVGDLRETLPRAAARFRARVALLHLDTASSNRAASERLAAELAPHMAPLLRPGAVIASGLPLPGGSWHPLPLPSEVEEGRYYLYQVPPAA